MNCPIHSRFAAALLVLSIAACFSTSKAAATDDDLLAAADARIETIRKTDAVVKVVGPRGFPLRNADVRIEQTKHAFIFGSNIYLYWREQTGPKEAEYLRQFADLLNFAVVPFYWWEYNEVEDKPHHDRTDRVIEWCKKHDIAVKGHTLFWNVGRPAWAPDDLGELESLVLKRIDEYVARFRGDIRYWDVVNEAAPTHAFRGGLWYSPMTQFWLLRGHEAFIYDCFQHARNADPNARLVLNDLLTTRHHRGWHVLADWTYEALIERLLRQYGPCFDVIGIQSHMHAKTWTNQEIWDVCETFGRFGIPLHFTEVTIVSGPWRSDGTWTTTDEGEKTQADEAVRLYTMLFSHPAVEGIIWWDFCDKFAWRMAPAGLIREDMTPKPAYNELRTLIKEKWWTRQTVHTNWRGAAKFRGFFGDYRITVRIDNEDAATAEMTLAPDASNKLRIKID